jgi:SulP family sulfate permease
VNAHYSASIESIRAKSLALGDMYMKEASPQEEAPTDLNDNLVSAVPPKSSSSSTSSTQSILSHLLKQDQNKKLNEQAPLIQNNHKTYHTISPVIQEEEINHPNNDLENQRAWSKKRTAYYYQVKTALNDPKVLIKCLVQPVTYIPAVILGLLLNLLDAISYGMITFPLNNPIFASFGPDGISMFFVR